MASLEPHYVRIADEIEQEIRSGKRPAGSKLPSTAELAKQLNVGTSTVYRAIRELHARNLVDGQKGAGVYVK